MADDEKPILFEDLVKRQEARDNAATAIPPPPRLPPQRTPPPPVLDPNNVIFGSEMEPQATEIPFEMLTLNSVFDQTKQIPTGRLFSEASSRGEELYQEDTVLVDPIDSRFVTVTKDVWEEMPPAGGGQTNHILRFSRGSRLPRIVVQNMLHRPVPPVEPPVEPTSVVVIEPKGKPNAR